MVAALVAPQLSSSARAATPTKLTSTLAAHLATNMLRLLNAERVLHGKRALHMNPRLIASAHRHNLAMAKTNVMSHQLPREPFFAVRISRTGYHWRSAGENIGWNSVLTNLGVIFLQRAMYSEKAPNDHHRVNILNSSYRDIGIDVYFDTRHHKVWFTQDLGQPA